MQPKGLIFDCDGTIVDTMPIHYAAWCATTVKHGLQFPEDRFYALGGVSPFEVLRMLSEEQGVEINAAAVTFQKEAKYMELIGDADEIPEVMQIVRDNHGKIPMAIALIIQPELNLPKLLHWQILEQKLNLWEVKRLLSLDLKLKEPVYFV